MKLRVGMAASSMLDKGPLKAFENGILGHIRRMLLRKQIKHAVHYLLSTFVSHVHAGKETNYELK
ncbi:unnamed protein product [Dovyalis caffra]|uniref:Uncharacterized protein n=1 Tax=Dovyalis caffra TaxID=77055 RepID=A0AAV1RSY4_9ROSI|nr:unnamed protein product [Dovyalis caffra]